MLLLQEVLEVQVEVLEVLEQPLNQEVLIMLEVLEQLFHQVAVVAQVAETVMMLTMEYGRLTLLDLVQTVEQDIKVR
jgi:hypothetical protein